VISLEPLRPSRWTKRRIVAYTEHSARPCSEWFPGRTSKPLAVHIRLRRVGKTKAPTYRVVIADSRAPRNGKFIETIGHYDPLAEPARLVVDAERARHWFKNGARPTSTTRSLLIRSGIPEDEVPAKVR
jgi:small subunit ribosomal protein S16